MTHLRWAILLIVLLPAASHGQWVGPSRGGVQIGVYPGGVHFSVSRGLYGPGFCNPYLGFSKRFTQVQIITPPPVFLPPPVLYEPVPLVPFDMLTPPPLELPPFDEVMGTPPDPPLPGRETGRFRPLDPDNRERARRPLDFQEEDRLPVQPPPQPLPPPPAPEKKPAPPVEPLPRLPLGPPIDIHAQGEQQRLLELGRQAFARGEYGRAAERFRKATVLDPGDGLAQLLLAQAQLALGNYRRAFDALIPGLSLRPDWPASSFRPILLYGERVTDHEQHLAELLDTLANHPDDPVLLFLSAYQLWFDGRMLEARVLLDQVTAVFPHPGLLERFLEALPSEQGL